MKNRVFAIWIILILFSNSFIYAKDKNPSLENLVDLAEFNLKVVKVDTLNEINDDELTLDLKDSYKESNYIVVFSLEGVLQTSGSFILSPYAFVAEYLDGSTWAIESASAAGIEFTLVGGKEKLIWIQSGVKKIMSADWKVGADIKLKVAFILPKHVKTVRIGITKFINELIQIK